MQNAKCKMGMENRGDRVGRVFPAFRSVVSDAAGETRPTRRKNVKRGEQPGARVHADRVVSKQLQQMMNDTGGHPPDDGIAEWIDQSLAKGFHRFRSKTPAVMGV